MVKLQKALEASYLPTKQASSYLKDDGYVMDDQLSNINSKVYINPQTKNVLMVERGSTNFLNDWISTDIPLAFGYLKKTKRFHDEQRKYNAVKQKYQGSKITLAGHSLGGSLASALGQKDDKIVSYNKGAGFGTATSNKKNETAYREASDLISAGSTNMKHQPKTMVGSVHSLLNPIQAHNINNLENRKIDI